MTSFSRGNLIGVLCLCSGVFVFSLQDAILKSLSGDYAVTLAIVLRSIVGLPLLALMVHFESGLTSLRTKNWPLLVLRGAILLISYTTYYLAFPTLPLAEAVALFFTAPIFVTLLAAVTLREHVSLGSWGAVVLGFIGVVVILQPGSSLFKPAALLSLFSAAAYALSMILARQFGSRDSTTVMAFYVNAVYMIVAALMALAFHLTGFKTVDNPTLDFLIRPWTMPESRDLFLLGLCGVIAASGMALLTHAYRLANANVVTVFEYSGMLWVPLWGYLLFSEVPKVSTLLGTAIIISAGIIAVKTSSESRS
jgi:drug/metabolite transporter (DMT)-like permease